MNSQETIDLKMVSKEESEPRLLIIRGLAIVLVIWVAAQLYVISATGGDQSDRSLSSILNEKSMKAKELQDRLNVLVALGDSSDLYETRDEWMLLLLKNNLKEKSLESAREQMADLSKDKAFDLDRKLFLYENIALVFRSTENYEDLAHIYRLAKGEIEASDYKNKKLYLARLENNRAVSSFFEGLSMEAPSIEGLDKRIKEFESSESQMVSSIKEIKQINKSEDLDSKRIKNLESILSKNRDEIDQELVFARLRRSAYQRELRQQKY